MRNNTTAPSTTAGTALARPRRATATPAPAEVEHPTTGPATTAAQGLVTCAITSRVSISPAQRPTRYRFADAEECRAGAAAVGPWEWDGREGPVPTLEVAPGLIRLTAPDLNRREKSANRAADRPAMVSDGSVSEEAAALLEGIEGMDAEECPGGTRGVVRGWSRKSRARMVAALAEVDLAPLLMAGDDPAMVTLTYPGRWEEVAPDGETVKRHLGQFWKRYERAWGPVCAVWKLEFQRRGAPHFHILMAPPGGVAGAVRRRVHEEAVRRWELEGGSPAPLEGGRGG